MKKSVFLLLLAVPLVLAAYVEIGSSQVGGTKPFCGNWTNSLRYQVVVNASEFSEAMVINSLTFFKAPGASHNSVTFDEFYVDMGYCASDELVASYDDNYVDGAKYRVFDSATAVTFLDTDPTIYFETPFFYVPANGNLVFEISWPSGKDEIYTYFSTTTGVSTIHGAYDNPVGDPWMEVPHILINGDMALDQMTFAGIKASFR